MTAVELVRKYFPRASDSMVDYLLYERTPFPVCSDVVLEQRLKEERDRIIRQFMSTLPVIDEEVKCGEK